MYRPLVGRLTSEDVVVHERTEYEPRQHHARPIHLLCSRFWSCWKTKQHHRKDKEDKRPGVRNRNSPSWEREVCIVLIILVLAETGVHQDHNADQVSQSHATKLERSDDVQGNGRCKRKKSEDSGADKCQKNCPMRYMTRSHLADTVSLNPVSSQDRSQRAPWTARNGLEVRRLGRMPM